MQCSTFMSTLCVKCQSENPCEVAPRDFLPIEAQEMAAEMNHLYGSSSEKSGEA